MYKIEVRSRVSLSASHLLPSPLQNKRHSVIYTLHTFNMNLTSVLTTLLQPFASEPFPQYGVVKTHPSLVSDVTLEGCLLTVPTHAAQLCAGWPRGSALWYKPAPKSGDAFPGNRQSLEPALCLQQLDSAAASRAEQAEAAAN